MSCRTQFATSVYLLVLAAAALASDSRNTLDQYGRQTWLTENGLPQNTVRAILQSRQGYLWLATEGGLVRFDGVRFAVFDTETTPEIKSNNITSLLEDHAGVLWFGTSEGLSRLDNGQFRTYTTADGLPADNIRSLFLDRAGAVCATATTGTVRFNNGHFVPTKDELPANTIERFPAGDPLSRDTILSTYQDREGNLWVGTDSSGLTILRKQPFTTYTNDQVRCVFEDRHANVWIGTNGGGLTRFSNGKIGLLTTANGLASNVILSLAEDISGDLLIGTPDGLNRLHDGKFSLLTSADGLAEDFVRSLYADTDGSVWAGTRRGLSHIKDGRVTTYTQANGLGSDLIGAIVRAPNNDLWIGTLHGLTRLRNGTFRNYTVDDGLSGNIVTDLYLDSQGTLWIATQSGGLGRFRDEIFTRFPPQLGIPETIYGITEDSAANLWLAAKTGIFRVSKSELNAFAGRLGGNITVVPYGTSDGLRVSECSGGGHPAVWKDRSGAIWFSTAKGAAVLRSGGSTLNRLPPPVVIESVLVDDRAFDPARLTEVAPGHSRLSFEYAGLSFIAPQKVQFRYRLEGFDRDWIDAGTRRIAYYTNVPPGHYRFHVIARNNDGFWNQQGASFAIYLQPHYYQTWWFALLLLAAATVAAYAIYSWRVRQVQAQFDAVLKERNRIAREIHDTLAQGFVGVSVQLEIVARLLNSSIDSAKEHLDMARVVVRNSLSDARESIWELRSQSSEHQDFAARLANAAKQVTASSSARVQLQVHGTYRPLAAKVEDELFRIGQEAVANAVRHSGAEHINIELTFDARKLCMTIGDDGCGFDAPPDSTGPNGHFGLQGMRERAQQIHAELTVNSEIGKGTSVCIEVPTK
jgi:signal transduction histidine kinase/ligand-binding sensor domain-containing protein